MRDANPRVWVARAAEEVAAAVAAAVALEEVVKDLRQWV